MRRHDFLVAKTDCIQGYFIFLYMSLTIHSSCHGGFFTFRLLVVHCHHEVVMLQSTALDDSSCINPLLLYKQDSQKRATELVEHTEIRFV